MKSGIAVMVLGVIVLLCGIGVIALAPWRYIQKAQSTASTIPSVPIPEEVTATINWLLYTFIVLIGNLFLSGIALIFAGYGLYKVKVKET